MKKNPLRECLPAAFAFAAFGLAACVSGPPAGTVYASIAPPAPVVELDVMGVAPGPDHVWIAGHHAWEKSQYVWVPGRWDKRPHGGAHWVKGEWHHHERGWYWTDGHWK
jgi:hypothetical protein